MLTLLIPSECLFGWYDHPTVLSTIQFNFVWLEATVIYQLLSNIHRNK